MSLLTRVRAARTALAHRRTEGTAVRTPSNKLDAFWIPRERNALEDVLYRYNYEETRLIRAVLNHHDRERQRL